MSHLPIKERSREIVLRSRVFSVERRELELSSGKIVQRDVVVHPGAVVVIPVLDKDTLVMIRQFRAPLQKELLEFPAGTLESGEDPLVCARRELAEEASAAAERWQSAGILYPAPGFCTEQQFIYVASELAEAQAEKDEDEVLRVEHVTRSEFQSLVSRRLIQDGKTIAAFFLAEAQALI